MNWWTSIVFYLWRNSLRRWIEQPLGLVAKLLIAALIGVLGAVMIAGASFLGDELGRQLASRDALMVAVQESVPQRHANAMLAIDDPEPDGWAALASSVLIYDVLPTTANAGTGRNLAVVALRSPEALGFPDTVVLLSDKRIVDSTVVITLEGLRFEAVVMRPDDELLATAMGDHEWIVASARRLSPLLQQGFTRNVLMQAKSVDEIERADEIADVLRFVEQRQVTIRSALPLLRQLREIRMIQRYVLVAVTLGSALVLGLVCGALAWMEFREERYLLALIRSFGVGRVMLLVHAVAENCLVAVSGVALGFGLLALAAGRLDLAAMQLEWLGAGDLLVRRETLMLLAGALFGGLLSCIPVGMGLRKPLGLVLK
jgi:hypothetical protein